MNALCEEMFDHRDWSEYVFKFDRPQRLRAFVAIMNRLSDPEYWTLLRDVWMDAEFPTVNRIHWLRLFRCARNSRSELMTIQDHKAFAALPNPIKIYRGAAEKFARGISWTTDVPKATWFAERFEPKGRVFTTELPKNKFLAYFLGREEAEAVIDPHYGVLPSDPAS